MPTAYVTTNDGQKVVIAKSDDTIRIEGNHYFPPESVTSDLLIDSDYHTTCHWKGEASYKTVKFGDTELPEAAWYYPQPKDGSVERVGKDFSNYVAFWRGVEVSD